MMKQLGALFACLSISVAPLFGQAKPSIRGVWRVVEVQMPNVESNKSPQPGIYILTSRHYSFIRDTATDSRPDIKDITNITPEEALATFGPFFAQSGTYVVKGATLALTPLVTKVPPQQGKYGGATYGFKLEGNSLWLTQLTGARGKIANQITLRLARLE